MKEKDSVIKTYIKKYGHIEADIANMHDKYVELLCETKGQRARLREKLRRVGVPAKLMSYQTFPKGHKYRYCLNVWFK